MIYNEFPEFICALSNPVVGSKNCPVCGDGGLHLFRIEIIMGEQVVVFKPESEISIEKVVSNSSRGVVVRLYYSCENMEDSYHGFLQEIKFCKGTIFEKITPLYVHHTHCFIDVWRD